jgi:PAS domain S-box-containing protein
MSAEASNVASARRFVQQRLTGAGLDQDLVETAVLLTSEVVTNAVMHAGSEFELRVSIRPGVRIEIRDRSQQLPQRRMRAAESVGGWGLELVESLATDFGVTAIPDRGKSVWFVVDNDGPAANGGWKDEPAAATTGTPVFLLNFPYVLWEVMYEHNEALLREYRLYRLDRPTTEQHELDVTGVERLRQKLANAMLSWRDSLAGDPPPSHLDLALVFTESDRAASEVMASVFADAEGLAAEGMLLTRPALPEIVALRNWTFDQFHRQLGGEPAERWIFKEQQLAPAKVVLDIDPAWIADPARAVIVADERGWIVAASKAVEDLLGWAPDDLAGRRLTEIIPTRLREAHIAGLTRQLITGRHRVLDTDLELPALHRSGKETTVWVTLTREQRGVNVLFLGRMSAIGTGTDQTS